MMFYILCCDQNKTYEAFPSKWWNHHSSKCNSLQRQSANKMFSLIKYCILLVLYKSLVLVFETYFLIWFIFSKTMSINWHGLIEKPIAPNPLSSKHLSKYLSEIDEQHITMANSNFDNNCLCGWIISWCILNSSALIKFWPKPISILSMFEASLACLISSIGSWTMLVRAKCVRTAEQLR